MIDEIKNYSASIFHAIGKKICKILEPTVRYPSRWEFSKKYATCSESAHWDQVYDQHEVELSEPCQFGKKSPNFDWWIDDTFPPLGVLELEDGYFFGKHGWVVTEDHVLLSNHSWYGKHVDEISLGERRTRLMRWIDPYFRVRRLNGTCLSLTSDWSAINYGHFLLDGLSRIELFNRSSFSLSNVDHILVPYPNPAWGRFIDQLGLCNKVIEPQEGWAYRADRILAPSFPGTRAQYHSCVVNFLQRQFLSEAHSQRRRLYIPRTTTRLIENEDALIRILKEYDFEIFEPVDHDNPPEVFAQAEIVVGGHGAGLADIAFCQPGTDVLELIPSDHVRPYWYTLAEAADLEYSYIVGPSTRERDDPMSGGPSPFDFQVDEDVLAEALEEIAL